MTTEGDQWVRQSDFEKIGEIGEERKPISDKDVPMYLSFQLLEKTLLENIARATFDVVLHQEASEEELEDIYEGHVDREEMIESSKGMLRHQLKLIEIYKKTNLTKYHDFSEIVDLGGTYKRDAETGAADENKPGTVEGGSTEEAGNGDTAAVQSGDDETGGEDHRVGGGGEAGRTEDGGEDTGDLSKKS